MTFFALLAATGHAIYQAYGVPGVTNWEIFYNANNYLLYAAIFYEQGEIYKERVMWRYFFRTVCFFWMYSLFSEFNYWNESYAYYREQMVSYGVINNMNTILVAAVVIILVDISKKYGRKIN